MDHPSSVLVALFVAFVAAKLAAEAMERLGQPSVVGELAVGILVGPSVLGWVPISGHDGDILLVLAELGVIVLLFQVGLETEPAALRAVGREATIVAILGVLLPFALGFGGALGLGARGNEAAFVATALVATSVGITARVLSDLGALARRASRVILGAAVIDDVLGLLVLTVVVGVAAGSFSAADALLLTAEAILFVGVVFVVGQRVVSRLADWLEAPKIPRAPFAIALTVLLGLSALAAEIGLAAIIGAFLAGTLLSGTRDRYALEHRAEPVADLLTPFFFVVTGAQIDLAALADGKVLLFAAVITVLAVAGKLAGGYVGARSLGARDAMIVGVGMVPRGEVGIIVASIGLRENLVGPDIFGAVLAMVVVTTMAAPPILQRLLRTAPVV